MRPPLRSRRGVTLLELVVVAAIISILSGVAVTVLARSRDRAQLAVCQSNMRQLGFALSMYAQDHGGLLPQVHYGEGDLIAKWSAAITPYCQLRDIQCPLWDRRATGLWLSYVLNSAFSHGESLLEVPDPSATILAAERRPGYTHLDYHWQAGPHPGPGVDALALEDSIDVARHAGMSNYLFVDGHTETMPLDYTIQPINLHDPHRTQ